MADKVIRCSSLPSWEDCKRRGAATSFPELIREAGFTLRRRLAHVGALVGSGTHAGAAFTLKTKMDTGELGNASEAADRGVEELRERLQKEGAVWDDTTKDFNTAEQQVVRMVAKYREKLAPQITPLSVEEEMSARLADGFILRGHTDAIAEEYRRLRDLKTGVSQRANGSQYGAYMLLCRTLGKQIDQIVEDYLPRVRLDQEQPDPEITLLPTLEPQQRAYEIIEGIRGSVAEFERRLKDDADRPPELAFDANPMSVLCSDRFCPAWGTDFCRAHKGAKT